MLFFSCFESSFVLCLFLISGAVDVESEGRAHYFFVCDYDLSSLSATVEYEYGVKPRLGMNSWCTLPLQHSSRNIFHK